MTWLTTMFTAQATPAILLGLAMLAYALTRLPDKYRPAWSHRLDSWRTWIGLLAVIIAIVIMMNPEFYALGILGDSAFFDFLVLCLTFQLQSIATRIATVAAGVFSPIKRFAKWRFSTVCTMLLVAFETTVTAIQKIIHRLSS